MSLYANNTSEHKPWVRLAWTSLLSRQSHLFTHPYKALAAQINPRSLVLLNRQAEMKRQVFASPSKSWSWAFAARYTPAPDSSTKPGLQPWAVLRIHSAAPGPWSSSLLEASLTGDTGCPACEKDKAVHANAPYHSCIKLCFPTLPKNVTSWQAMKPMVLVSQTESTGLLSIAQRVLRGGPME